MHKTHLIATVASYIIIKLAIYVDTPDIVSSLASSCNYNSNDLANQLVYCMAGKQSASLDGYIAYIDIGDGLCLGVTLAFDAETYHQLL